MKNHFVPTFHRKQYQAVNKNTAPYFIKNAQTLHQNTPKTHVKKTSFHVDAECSQNNVIVPAKSNGPNEAEAIASDQKNSCKSSQTTIKPSKMQHKMVKQPRAVSPFKYSNTSPLKTLASMSPKIKQSQISSHYYQPIRSTLKHLLHPKQQIENNLSETYSRQMQGNTSFRVNKTFTDTYHSPHKNKDKQYLILKEQNQVLKRQLEQIKKKLINKKEESRQNLRDTIKKQDNEIKELRVKLQIFTKRNNVLISMIENKDEEIAFITTKLQQTQLQLRQFKQKNAQKFQKLKERINFMLKSYNDLQIKWTQSELEWLDFKSSWMQQKETYIQRIDFLEQYIANS